MNVIGYMPALPMVKSGDLPAWAYMPAGSVNSQEDVQCGAVSERFMMRVMNLGMAGCTACTSC